MKNTYVTLMAILSTVSFMNVSAAQQAETKSSGNDLPGLMQESRQSGSQSADQVAQATGGQLSQDECNELWTTAVGTSDNLSQDKAMNYTESFSQVDENSDGQLSKTEFVNACQEGSVHRMTTTGGQTASDGSAATTSPQHTDRPSQ